MKCLSVLLFTDVAVFGWHSLDTKGLTMITACPDLGPGLISVTFIPADCPTQPPFPPPPHLKGTSGSSSQQAPVEM